jgi:hypothetical protein
MGETMAFLTAADIFNVDDTRYDEVNCPEWGGTVRLRSIKGTQRDAYEQSVITGNGADRKLNLRNARAKLIVLCAVDGDGRALFSSDDVNRLGAKNAAPLDRLFDACRKLCGMSEEDVEKLSEDFGATQRDDVITD